jgi:hypothetical protein
MKKFLTIAFTILALAVSASAQVRDQYGRWWYYYNGTWYQVQAPNSRYNTPQPPPIAGNHGYYWYPGHYGPTGTWYPGLWLAY